MVHDPWQPYAYLSVHEQIHRPAADIRVGDCPSMRFMATVSSAAVPPHTRLSELQLSDGTEMSGVVVVVPRSHLARTTYIGAVLPPVVAAAGGAAQP